MMPHLKKMLRIAVSLNTSYSKQSNVEIISDDFIIEFINEYGFESFEDLFSEIENSQVKNAKWEDRKDCKLNKMITYVYSSIMDFPQNKFEIKTVVTKEFFNNVRDLISGGYVIHHSHVTGEIIGYAHDFCNKKIRENNNFIPIFVHNLFSFDFLFVAKGIRLCVSRTKQLNIGGTNLTNVQYANIGNQVKFIDTIKYYQQSLLFFAQNASEIKKKNIRTLCLKFIEKNETYSAIFNSLPDNDKNWILDYLRGGKGVIH